MLAHRSGKKEEDILKEDLAKEKVHVSRTNSTVFLISLLCSARGLDKCAEQIIGVLLCDMVLWLSQLRLTKEQQAEKEDAEGALEELQTELATETDPEKKKALEESLEAQKEKMAAMMDGFAVRAPGLRVSPVFWMRIRGSHVAFV